MRETFFGPLIKEVETHIIDQMGDQWNRDFFENHLMAYTIRTNTHRLIAYLDHRNTSKKPIYLELFDHTTAPEETTNIAPSHPETTEALLTLLRTYL